MKCRAHQAGWTTALCKQLTSGKQAIHTQLLFAVGRKAFPRALCFTHYVMGINHPGNTAHTPCASLTAAGAESAHLCLGIAFYTAGKPSSSSQSASPPHSPFFLASPHRYRCHRCRQPRGHAGRKGSIKGWVQQDSTKAGAHALLCRRHRAFSMLKGQTA